VSLNGAETTTWGARRGETTTRKTVQQSKVTQTETEIARSTQFFSSLLVLLCHKTARAFFFQGRDCFPDW
jgi:hypothetical protein